MTRRADPTPPVRRAHQTDSATYAGENPSQGYIELVGRSFRNLAAGAVASRSARTSKKLADMIQDQFRPAYLAVALPDGLMIVRPSQISESSP